MFEGSVSKRVSARQGSSLVRASVYDREFLVQIDDNDVSRGATDGGGLE